MPAIPWLLSLTHSLSHSVIPFVGSNKTPQKKVDKAQHLPLPTLFVPLPFLARINLARLYCLGRDADPPLDLGNIRYVARLAPPFNQMSFSS